MAHITRICIEGLLGRKQPIEMSLDRTVNVFFGENGCGKTTLLKILQSVLSQDGDAMIGLPVQRAEVDIYSLTDQKVISHFWDRKNISRENDFSLEMLRSYHELDFPIMDRAKYLAIRNSASEWKISGAKKSKDVKKKTWAHCFLPTTRLYNTDPTRRGVEQRTNTEDRLNEAFAESVNKRWLLYYTQILQEVRNIQEEGLREVLYHSLSIALDSPVGPTLNPIHRT